MRYIAYNGNSEEIDRGEIRLGDRVPVPDAACMSVEVAEGMWLNIDVSEWGNVACSGRPYYPDAVPYVPPPRHRYRCEWCGAEATAVRLISCRRCSWMPMMKQVEETAK